MYPWGIWGIVRDFKILCLFIFVCFVLCSTSISIGPTFFTCRRWLLCEQPCHSTAQWCSSRQPTVVEQSRPPQRVCYNKHKRDRQVPIQGSFCVCAQPMRRRCDVTSTLIGWAHAQHDPMPGKIFPHYWPFVRVITMSLVDSTHKVPVMRNSGVSLSLFSTNWSRVVEDLSRYNTHVKP